MSAYLKIKVLPDLQPKALRAASSSSRLPALLLLLRLLLQWLLLRLLRLLLLGLRRAGRGKRHDGDGDALAEVGVELADGGEEHAYEHGGRGPELRARGRREAQGRC